MSVNEFDHPFIAATYDQVEGSREELDRPGREWVVIARRLTSPGTEG